MKLINVKNWTSYFFNDAINIKDFHPSLIKKTKVIQKHWYLSYQMHHKKSMSDCENINSVNPLYLIIGNVDGYIEESNGNKYLTFSSTDRNKKVLEKYSKLLHEIKYHIQAINANKSGEYDKDYMKIKCNSNDDLPLNRVLNLHMLTIIVGSVFEEDV